ncbi:MAG: Zn-dependent hydrolase, partial [Rhodospirillaceae bacterium]|nr:Zn-dependent hydrolase [Rhodospirillaceae bacterium]
MTLDTLRTDADRLWATLSETARFGATGRGGLARLALGPADGQVRDWLVAEATALGCTVQVDPIGNIFATRAGSDPGRAPVACGSHLDTQPTGGRFDGILGVLAGLEVLRTLARHDVATAAPITLINWTNEEGSRFAPGLIGSSVHLGLLDLETALALHDGDGATMGGCLAEIGYAGSAPLGPWDFDSYFELHIEQGPVLEAGGLTIGVVTGAQGMRWYDIAVKGAGGHAGTVPMALRHDAMVAAADLVGRIRTLATARNRPAVATVGRIEIPGASRNTIPASALLTLDVRHPEAETLDAIEAGLAEVASQVGEAHGVRVEFGRVSNSPPVAFDPTCVGAVRTAALRCGYRHADIVSGAGHDACAVAGFLPTGMIFVPCKDGVSHQEHEDMTREDAAAGADVLLHAVLARAG